MNTLVNGVRGLGQFGLFLFAILRATRPDATFWRALVQEIYKIGARSLPIVLVGGAFVGLSVTLLGYRALDTYGASNQVSALLGLGLYRELAPVLTALLFIGRAGSSIAAELGLMRATDQITALELMAVDAVGRVVAPRFWAAVLCVPLLVAMFVAAAIVAGWFESVQVIGLDAGTFWQVLKDAVDRTHDFVPAFVKAAVFGGIAAWVAAHAGFHAEPTIEGTSVATTRAVVNASLMVLMFNFVLSALMFR